VTEGKRKHGPKGIFGPKRSDVMEDIELYEELHQLAGWQIQEE
jgi:hypothetical protein